MQWKKKLERNKMEFPKYYDVGKDQLEPITQEELDKIIRVQRRQHNRNVVIRLISNLNISNEDDMKLLVEIANKLENREFD